MLDNTIVWIGPLTLDYLRQQTSLEEHGGQAPARTAIVWLQNLAQVEADAGARAGAFAHHIAPHIAPVMYAALGGEPSITPSPLARQGTFRLLFAGKDASAPRVDGALDVAAIKAAADLVEAARVWLAKLADELQATVLYRRGRREYQFAVEEERLAQVVAALLGNESDAPRAALVTLGGLPTLVVHWLYLAPSGGPFEEVLLPRDEALH